ncbi:integrase catalytic domain-containing protein [Trichonephila clavipes]|nr:integrase catalytic domain-containing protein [Trichonephila clavipes]
MNLRSSQLMGDLPPIRFQQIRPFESTGLDFAGPLTTKCAHKRSVTKFKSYICLFICTATKAVHLELVSDLSTAAFLAALRRFIARKSCPSKIISDNGSNFKGASSHLRKLVDLCLQEEVQNFLSLKGIEWSFIPLYTPHFGGLWESAIKSAKQLLIKATNSVLLNFEECSTLLIQIEACLNSRPLTELSPDPSDFTTLTPAHFLVGGPIHQFPEPSQHSSVGLSERWNLIQRLRQYFWDRWSTEYLHRLQPRSKWWRTKPNLQLGDMVIVEKEKTAPLNWTLGRIDKLFFGPDQKVRVLVHEIRWKFNPPSSPWWGGFWERLIGILKDLLRKILGAPVCLTRNCKLVCECESVMNSRPLTYISEEQELKTLTPSMFLQDIPLNDVPDLDQIQKTNIVLRWRYIQKVRENLKQRFKREYLGILRSSVIKREDKINGDIVLIGTDDKKRLHWLLGRVLELFPGKDGIIRLVKLRTERGDMLRPIQRLYPLEVTSNQLRNL